MTARERSRMVRGLVFIGPWLIGFLSFSAYPLVATAVFSLTDYSVLSRPVFIGGGNYQDLITDSIFWQALSNTLVFAFLAVPLKITERTTDEDRVIGVLKIERWEDSETNSPVIFSDADVHFGQMMSDIIATEIFNIEMSKDQLQRLSNNLEELSIALSGG